MATLNLVPGRVISLDRERSQVQFVTVQLAEQECRAVNYLALGEPVAVGQEVLLNTTAVDLGLGSGGNHFIVPAAARMGPGWGHQVKLRYTPLQIRVNCAEEQQSPWHQKFQVLTNLGGVPVLVAELHSMLGPLALAIQHQDPGARTIMVCSDGGALPLALSDSVEMLKAQRALAGTVTCGQAFGGDLETVNVFTGVQAARYVLSADYIIVTIGPGIAGTGTVFGFSGLEQGFALQAASALGGTPIFVPRISFADQRSRHRGISHHSLTVLTHAFTGRALIPLPLLGQPRRRQLARALRPMPSRYRICWRQGGIARVLAEANPQLFQTMGRQFSQDQEFFATLGAAARVAVECQRSNPALGRIAIK